MSARVVSVGEDLFFWSRIFDAARGAGRTAVRIADEAGMQEALAAGDVAVVLVDLSFGAVDSIAWASRWKAADPAPRLVAYAPHVDAETHARAREAGFDLVLPKSRFHQILPELVR